MTYSLCIDTDKGECSKKSRKVVQIIKAVNSYASSSGELIEGVGWVPEEVSKVLKDIGKEIDKLGKMIELKEE